MRLWHEALLPFLPRQQLLGQHRECCALRGRGWGKKHSTVNYVFEHHPMWLVAYHYKVMEEMVKRGFNVNGLWYDIFYRGQFCDPYSSCQEWCNIFASSMANGTAPVYLEHDREHLQECLDNLAAKGIHINTEEA